MLVLNRSLRALPQDCGGWVVTSSVSSFGFLSVRRRHALPQIIHCSSKGSQTECVAGLLQESFSGNSNESLLSIIFDLKK